MYICIWDTHHRTQGDKIQAWDTKDITTWHNAAIQCYIMLSLKTEKWNCQIETAK